MHYRLFDPARTSYRHPFYGYGADDASVGRSDSNTGTGTVGSGASTGSPTGIPSTLETSPPAVETKPITLGPSAKTAKQGFSFIGPLVAFGTSFLASYVVAKHVGVDKPKAMNLAVTMGILSGVGQAAAQVLQGWIDKAQTQIDSGTVVASGTSTALTKLSV
jgi:hypothetical protein